MKNTTKTKLDLPAKIVALVHFGRSGSGLLHSLIDGHPKISTLPSIYFSEFFNETNWKKISENGWSELVDRFISIYDVLFDATSPQPVESIGKTMLHNIGIKEGLANVGPKGNEVLTLNKAIFKSELSHLTSLFSEINPLIFFKLVHISYERAIKNYTRKDLIFYTSITPTIMQC